MGARLRRASGASMGVRMDETAPDEGAVGSESIGPFTHRASIVLLLDAVLVAIGIGVVAAAGAVTGPAPAITLALAGATACAALVLAVALRRNRSWAPVTGLVVLCAVLVLGLARTVIAFRGGSIQVPIDSILAGWALLAPGLPPIGVRTVRVPGALLAAVLLIGEVGATVIVPLKQVAGPPPSDPARAVMVTNLSPHAVLVSAGGLLVGAAYLLPWLSLSGLGRDANIFYAVAAILLAAILLQKTRKLV